MVSSPTSWQNINQTSSALSHSFRVIVVPVHHYSPLFDCAGHWVPPLGSVVDLHLVQLEVDVDFHSGREGHWVRFRIQWVRFRIQLGIMHKQTWINHDRITLFKKFFQFPSLLIIVEFSTLKNLGNLTTKNSTHHEFVATDHEFVATDHEFVATDYEFVVWTSFIYWLTWTFL